MLRLLVAFALSAFVLGLSPLSASAHAVDVNCKLKAGKVEVEAYYDDDTPAHKAKVQIVNAKEEIVATGITDEKGLWSLIAPPAGKYEVRVDAGAGHRAKKAFEVPADAPSVTDEPLPREATISEGPTRAEFTSTPWLKVGIGLGTIGGLCGACVVASMIRNRG